MGVLMLIGAVGNVCQLVNSIASGGCEWVSVISVLPVEEELLFEDVWWIEMSGLVSSTDR